MAEGGAAPRHDPAAWWRHAVVYQVYIRSFADGDGDGVGDIAGLRHRLSHLVDLGVDAVWINPWYPSPMADAGYDIADYRAIDPVFGTLAEAEALVDDAHAAGLRVLLDIVPNHTSDQHPWFLEAVAGGPASPLRDRYLFRPGRGPGGDRPPNNWRSVFGGPAWTRVTEPDGRPGAWYLHLFSPQQPDLNWDDPEVRADFDATLRFWFDRGVDGFRVDVAHSLIKDHELPDLQDGGHGGSGGTDHPHWDRAEVHDVYRRWRAIAEGYDPPRVFVAEAWVDSPERLARYVRSDELHTAFNFDFLNATWTAAALRDAVDITIREHRVIGAPATWVLSNHDVARHVSRYARDQRQVRGHNLHHIADLPADLSLGHRRARAAVMLMLALPGSAYLYQGEELGLPEVEDLPAAALVDPTWARSGYTVRGRDGCRVPIPWSGESPPYGFSPVAEGRPWLPQPPSWRQHTVAALRADPDSILHLYRRALRLRRELPALGDGDLRWLPTATSGLAFERSPSFRCVVNLGPAPVALDEHGEILLASGPLTADGGLPQDTTVWIRTSPPGREAEVTVDR